jgi:uncharacterized membrane protein HdeD (DUF308 family)
MITFVTRKWWVLALRGLFAILFGVFAFLWPVITEVALLYLIAFWAGVIGFLEIIIGIRLRKDIRGEWLLVLGGIASILFGFLLIVWPGAGLLTLIWLIALYAVILGILSIALGFRVRSLKT